MLSLRLSSLAGDEDGEDGEDGESARKAAWSREMQPASRAAARILGL